MKNDLKHNAGKNLLAQSSELRGHSIRTSAGGGGRGLKIADNCGQGGWGGLSFEDVRKSARRAKNFSH